MARPLCYQRLIVKASDTDPAGFVPSTAPRPRRVLAGETDGHPLLPLAEAQDAVARLEATAATASPTVIEGLRARVAYREAGGTPGLAGIFPFPSAQAALRLLRHLTAAGVVREAPGRAAWRAFTTA